MSRPAPDRLQNRFRQRVAALNFAIQTTPPPETTEGREDLFNLHIQLFELYMPANFIDLARDQLKAALALNPSEKSVPLEAKIQMQGQLNQLENAITQLSQKMEETGDRSAAEGRRPGDVRAAAGGRGHGDRQTGPGR